LIGGERDKDGNLVSGFVGGGDTVRLGASISNLGKRTKCRGGGGRNGAFAVANEGPSKLVVIARLVLGAVTRLVNIAGALVDHGVGVINCDCNFITCFVSGGGVKCIGATIVVGQGTEGRGSGGSDGTLTVSYNLPAKLRPMTRLV
jgi:hypothetical protein